MGWCSTKIKSPFFFFFIKYESFLASFQVFLLCHNELGASDFTGFLKKMRDV